MIKSTNNESKRNRITGINYVLVSEATVRDFPGQYIQVLVTGWNDIKFSSVEFTETESVNGEFVIQELLLKIFGSDFELDQLIRSVIGNELLIQLLYANGDVKIMGTEDCPVILAHSFTGSPVSQTLSTTRNSAEKAKYLLS